MEAGHSAQVGSKGLAGEDGINAVLKRSKCFLSSLVRGQSAWSILLALRHMAPIVALFIAFVNHCRNARGWAAAARSTLDGTRCLET